MIATRLLVKCGLLTTEDHSLKPFSFPKVLSVSLLWITCHNA